jgi:NAD(P)-dependent dehydrogenase (short-subunit alcohol dehydrogenase family)
MEDVARAFEVVDEALGGMRGLVNCAVMAGPPARVADVRMEDVELVFRTNVIGALHCVREAVRRMSTLNGGGGGAIVSMTSAVAYHTGGAGTWVPFAASKAAVEAMSRGLAKELAPEGIRVNTVRCGVIATETRLGQPRDYLQRTAATIPMERMGEPKEVATSVLWLLSDDASYISGATLDVAGGL